MDISGLRADYTKKELLENSVDKNPILQFKNWFDEALESNVLEPNAMHLSTVNADLQPDGRIVLLKYLDENGACFFTNYTSKKAQEIANNNKASITFFWPELERQIRIRGQIFKIDEIDSEKYFAERPRLSQIGAWASPQSQKIVNRQVLESNFEVYGKKFENQLIPKPHHWGGYRLVPTYFEFWQGRRSRLHDRIIYTKEMGNEWVINRLAP